MNIANNRELKYSRITTKETKMKLSEYNNSQNYRLPIRIVEDMSNCPTNYLNNMWRSGEQERVKKILERANKNYESTRFNYKVIR